jgi:hypothetical protein
MDKRDLKIFEALALGLIRADLDANIPRKAIAKKCGFYQSALNKWLDSGQGMSSKSVEKVLKSYGIKIETIAEIITGFSNIPGFLENLARIGRLPNGEVKDKIVSDVEFYSKLTDPKT